MLYLGNRTDDASKQKGKSVFKRLAAYQNYVNSLNQERSQRVDVKDIIDVNTGQELFKPVINNPKPSLLRDRRHQPH